MLPSKEFRMLIECYDFRNGKLADANGVVRVFTHKLSDGGHEDRQEILLVDNEGLEKVKNAGYEIVWFFEILKQKNPLNKAIDNIEHHQKVRKYLVWTDASGQFYMHKFWDEDASNVRDKHLNTGNDLVNPFSSGPPEES